MSETQVLTMAAALVAAMFGLLATVLGWIGSRTITALDAMRDKLDEVASELHNRINNIDRRVTVMETFQQTCQHAQHRGPAP